MDPASLEPLFGVYSRADEEGEWRFYARGEQVLIMREDQAEQPVFAAGDDRFFLGPNSLTWFGASRGPAGVVTIELHPNGADQPVLHTRRGPIPPDPVVSREVLERYVGRYQLEKTIRRSVWLPTTGSRPS